MILKYPDKAICKMLLLIWCLKYFLFEALQLKHASLYLLLLHEEVGKRMKKLPLISWEEGILELFRCVLSGSVVLHIQHKAIA